MFHYDVALESGLTPTAIHTAMDTLSGRLVRETAAAPYQLAERIWILPDDSVARIFYDHHVDVMVLRAETKIPQAATDIIGRVGEVLVVLDFDELAVRAEHSDVAMRSFAIRAMATLTAHYSHDAFSALQAALRDPDATLRDDALRAIARWPHYVLAVLLDEAATREPDPPRATKMRELARFIREHGRRGL